MDIRGQNIKNYNVYTTKFNLYVVDLTQINRHQRRRLSETEITQTGKHMEKNYKLIIGYDGTRYFGWEHQPGKDTIQGKLEDVLNHLTEKPVLIIGAGRTDAGVHARAMAANVVLSVDMTAEQLRDYMNRYLPDDIIVQEVREASMRFHARYNAIGKTYCYTVFDGKTKPLFDRKYVWQLEKPVNIERMQKAAEYLTGEHDFMSFCKNPQKKKSTVRTVDQIEIRRRGDYVTLTFHGNGFLRNMVRILTGTLVAVGQGEMTAEQVKAALEAKDRLTAGQTAPAK
jgi:tRNA pseudouridine synthase A